MDGIRYLLGQKMLLARTAKCRVFRDYGPSYLKNEVCEMNLPLESRSEEMPGACIMTHMHIHLLVSWLAKVGCPLLVICVVPKKISGWECFRSLGETSATF